MVAPLLSMLSLHVRAVLFSASSPCVKRNGYRAGVAGRGKKFLVKLFQKSIQKNAAFKKSGTQKLLSFCFKG
ncbi:hypothetical protein RI056_02755 [Komagataeibacter nataicola]|nr:hypothetical protein RI056_02755 [Komagataeibacter nataicola]